MNVSTKVLPLRVPERGSASGLSDREDDELMLLARGGLAAAFDELVRRHQQRVLRIAQKYLGQVQPAKDAAQNTFVVIFRSLPRYRSSGRFRAYLHRVLLSQCHQAYRSRKCEARAYRSEGAGSAAPVGQETGLEASLLAEERRREVERALQRLSPKLKEALVLRFSGELSYQEIADTLEVPLGTVKRRIFDGLEKLRQALEVEPS